MPTQASAVACSDDNTGGAAALPFGYHDLNLVADAVLDVAPDWSVELSGMETGDSSLVIMPPEADDMIGPTFLLRRTTLSVHLDQLHWDEYSPVATIPSIDHAIASLRARLLALGMATAQTRH